MKQTTKKIAVLGGGLSAMTTIYHLMQEPDWQQKYDITVYQLGWRIGGKGASGVNTDVANRIEEHGLHLWMGFYENAFLMMENVYKDLQRSPDMPLPTLEDAFKTHNFFVFEEYINNEWLDWKIDFPTLPGTPGDGLMPNNRQFWERWINFIVQQIRLYYESNAPNNGWKENWSFVSRIWKKANQPATDEMHPLEKKVYAWIKDTVNSLEKKVIDGVLSAGEKMLNNMLHLLQNVDKDINTEKEESLLFIVLKRLRKWFWQTLEPQIVSNNLARRLWIIIDLSSTLIKGLLKDKIIVVENGKMIFNFDQVNEEDYTEWLIRHGANKEYTINSPLVRSMYDGPFSFVKGDTTKPNIEAGTILRIFLRLAFTCKKSVVWKMQAGMGDTIFAPIYELMKREGIKFKFFQNVRNLKLSADKTFVESIEIGEQVTLVQPYEPLININGLPCWPTKPNYAYIDAEEAQALQAQNIDLECHWRTWQDRNIIHLQKGIDFDEVVVGFSLGSVPHICRELVSANKAWQQMTTHVQTVQTQAYQLWFNQNAKTLQVHENKLVSTYTEPVDTFAAMNHLLKLEQWTPAQNVQYLAYFCGVLDEPTAIPTENQADFPQKEKQRVEENLRQYIKQHLQHLLKGAYNEETGEFKEDYLVASYARANISPSERYVLSVKGSSKFRIRTNETGFSNLYITGDWIQNGFNAGFVEGAVVAGIWTARKLSGNPAIPIIGEEWNQ